MKRTRRRRQVHYVHLGTANRKGWKVRLLRGDWKFAKLVRADLRGWRGMRRLMRGRRDLDLARLSVLVGPAVQNF